MGLSVYACECKKVKCMSAEEALDPHSDPSTKVLQNNPVDCLHDWTFCGLLLIVVSVSKSVCIANLISLLCDLYLYFYFLTEHDTRVMAKERQKKDNHNLSKYLTLSNPKVFS